MDYKANQKEYYLEMGFRPLPLTSNGGLNENINLTGMDCVAIRNTNGHTYPLFNVFTATMFIEHSFGRACQLTARGNWIKYPDILVKPRKNIVIF